MRIVIAVALAVVAIAAASLWALAEFGGASSSAVQGEPIIREPLAEPAAAPPPPAPQAALPPPPAPLPEPQPEPRAQTEPNPEIALRSKPLDETLAESLAPHSQPHDEQPAPLPEPLVQAARSNPALESAPLPAMTPSVAASVTSAYNSRRVTYNRPPERLVLDRAIDVSLVINATDDPDAGAEALQGFPGTVVDRDVELSETVSAQLTGVGFDISSQSVERQRLSGRTLNRWQWRVTPTETGTRTLILEIFGYEAGSLDAEPLDAYRDEITVEVEQLGQVISWARSVQPVFAVIAGLAAALSALFAFLRFREERKRGRD